VDRRKFSPFMKGTGLVQTLSDKLAGIEQEVFTEHDRKLEAARERRQAARQSAGTEVA
jgi:hypothetical protein